MKENQLKFQENNVCKKFAKIGLSTTRGGGFNPDFCFASQISSGAQALRAKPRKNMTTPKGRGFISYTKIGG